jgi:hypothetical protein
MPMNDFEGNLLDEETVLDIFSGEDESENEEEDTEGTSDTQEDETE